MKHEDVVSTGRRIIDHIAQRTLDLGEAPMRVDASVFTDPERLAKEREVLFRRTPQVVGWAGEVAEPGDFLARDVDGVPVLVTRDEDGVLHAFLNACTHRGMPVAPEDSDREGTTGTGCSNARRFVCGYHGWQFDPAGSLVGLPSRPQFPGVDPAEFGLKKLPVAISAGLIVVGLRPDVQVEGALADVEDAFAGFPYDRTRAVVSEKFTLKANWKLTVDINLEGYHIPFLHRATIHGVVLNHGIVDTFGPHTRFAVPILGFEKLAEFPEEHWPARLPMVNVQTVLPSTVLIESPMSTTMLRVYPGAVPGESVIHMTEGTWEPLDEQTVAATRNNHNTNKAVLVSEDFPGAEACQRGFSAGLDTMVVGMGESAVAHWHETWDKALAAY
ncbi:aromatic ring-hydroxylating oxygenase subunit alpha [Yinghuangia seranimata]|uniref:aromatic ring-hydroxylating oxygenase subunit alpha n=1 Tax=Yinghuangia seranimata TaxID=408067 RepID=UPI00248B4EB8|nr:aromatic ring-hydroxylating dioxygenase subunit alpha [Yinghuangia seranimata]MDI2125178.1 aromatic ring-hydroxylating dioxygenase subunit alpha [Yinghuangia seranimata]